MYLSNSNGNYNNVSYSSTGQDLDNNDNINPNYNPTSSFHFPSSPYIHYEEDAILLQHLHEVLQSQYQLPFTTDPNTVQDQLAMIHTGGSGNKKCGGAVTVTMTEQIPARKIRSSKKDRHSKIKTAHGLRDRRMRLSRDVAHKFFGLQDMLGFDKGSRTVEWLLKKSEIAIKDLQMSWGSSNNVSGAKTTSASSTSDCEVLSSGYEEQVSFNTNKAKQSSSCTKERKNRKSTAFHHPIARESREKARARARERTREKRRQGSESNLGVEAMNHLGSWSPFGTRLEESISQRVHNTDPNSFEVEEPTSRGNDSLLNVTGNRSLSPILYNYYQSAGISHDQDEYNRVAVLAFPGWESSSSTKGLGR
ncbi:hypothetical protein RJ639_002772 [Escallonia herrerae]|uniref:Uncharacterized protein n=1 Tax=Escallonia herrerae TaxID=1293975 RepID=A0AA89AZX4_9ASTE|nr:hypothetical protein RJ639_002772 [Escallonia herrerae]